MIRRLLLDTSVFSAVLKKEPEAQHQLLSALAEGSSLLASPVVYFELRRGLLKRQANNLLRYLDNLVSTFLWVDVLREDWMAAAQLWATTQAQGKPRGDADLIIAAQANRCKSIVITRNVKHFADITEIEEW